MSCSSIHYEYTICLSTCNSSMNYCRNNRLTMTNKYGSRMLQQSTIISLWCEQITGGERMKTANQISGKFHFTITNKNSNLPVLSNVANSAMRDLSAHVQIYNLACKLYYSCIMHTFIFWKKIWEKVHIIHEKIQYILCTLRCV